MQGLLLDTHVLLWALTDSPRLGVEGRALISEAAVVSVSAVSAWEITIKSALGKLRAPHDLLDQLSQARMEPLDITAEHALAVADLPDHHRDPFDRMLVAQARTENLTLVTHDDRIRPYDLGVHWIG